jgi:WD40 repeat protein
MHDTFRRDTLAFSPDGKTLAVQVRSDVELIDVEKGRTFQMLRAPESDSEQDVAGCGLSFSADGAVLADALDNNRVRLWDVASGKVATTLFIPDREQPIPLFSPDGRFLAVAGHRRTMIYELRLPELQTTMAQHPHALRHIAFTPDGRSLLCEGERKINGLALDGRVTQWDLSTEARQRVICTITYPGDAGRFRPARGGLAVHPDGSVVAGVSSLFGGFLWPMKSVGAVGSAAQAPDRPNVTEWQEEAFQLTAGSGIEIRDDPRASNGRAVRIAAGARERIRLRAPVEWSKQKANGWAVFAVCRVEGPRRPDIRVRGTTITPKGESGRSWELSHFPDDAYHIILLEYRSRGDEAKFDWIEDAIGLESPAGAENALWVDRVFRVPFKESPFDVSRQGPVAFAPDGKLWGVANENYLVSWGVPDLNVRQQWSNLIGATMLGSQRLQALAVGAKWVLAGADDGYVFVLSAKTAQWEAQGWMSPEGGVRALALDPSESIAAVGTEKGRLYLARVPDGQVLADLPGHTQSVESVAFSRDGGWLVSGSIDQTVRLWRRGDDGRFEHVMTLKAPPGRFAEVRLSPEGDRLAILNGSDRAVRVWRLDRLQSRLVAAGMGWK